MDGLSVSEPPQPRTTSQVRDRLADNDTAVAQSQAAMSRDGAVATESFRSEAHRDPLARCHIRYDEMLGKPRAIESRLGMVRSSS